MPSDTNATAEQDRLAALQSYHILDTATEEDFEELTELAAAICGTPISLISLVDENRQWFKSHRGLDVSETDRAYSFCAHAINQPTELMQVEDAHLDERFKDNPLVTGAPFITFYAGMPLVDHQGHALGSLCVIDQQQRRLTETQQKALRTLAKQVVDKLELRRKNEELEQANAALREAERQTAKATLERQQSDTRIRSLLQQAPVAVIVFRGKEMWIDEVNPMMLQLLGKSNDILQKNLLEAIPELEGQEPYQLLHRVLATGQPEYGYDVPVQLPNNGQMETRFFNFSYTPLVEEGNIVGVIDIAVEITEQVKARAEIARSQYRLSQMVATSPVGLCIFQGRDLLIEMANQPVLAVWNKTAAQTINRKLLDVFPELADQPYPQILQNIFDTGKPISLAEVPAYLHQPDGSIKTIYVNSTYEPLFAPDGTVKAILTTVVDLTEPYLLRKELETANEQLQQEEERLRLSIEAARQGLFNLDLATGIVEVNAYCREILGFAEDEVVTAENGFTMMEADDQRIRQAMADSIANDSPFEEEYRIIRRTDGSIRWVRSLGRPLKAGGKPIRFYGMMVDITERKEDEQRRNDFLGIVSHELKTPLTSMNAYVQMLSLKAKKINDTAIADIALKAKRQVDRMNAMISGFLDVARLGDSKIHLNRKVFDMAEVVKQAEEESLATVTTHQVVFAPVEYTPIDADAEKIEQVLVNFINNAVKYSPRGSTINIACVTNKATAYVSVKDEGMGIAPKDLPHLFERFYRVENEEMNAIKGFGIGLYICKEIIERHGGQIGVNSEVGKGSEFWFTLPVVD